MTPTLVVRDRATRQARIPAGPQYSEHSLRWAQLKGEGAIRGDTLCRAAEFADCETVLALVEIKETWDCSEPAPRYRRGWWNDAPSDDDETDDDETDDDETDDDETTDTITPGNHGLLCALT